VEGGGGERVTVNIRNFNLIYNRGKIGLNQSSIHILPFPPLSAQFLSPSICYAKETILRLEKTGGGLGPPPHPPSYMYGSYSMYCASYNECVCPASFPSPSICTRNFN